LRIVSDGGAGDAAGAGVAASVAPGPRAFVIADVFTRTPFAGNPLAVVLDAEGLSAEQMQAIAREFNYSETTFVLPPVCASATARVRIFTPRIEVPFAGHPNIGTAVVLGRKGDAAGDRECAQYVFEEEAGLVPVRLIREEGSVVAAELTAPGALAVSATVSVEEAAACLSLDVSDIGSLRHPPQVASVGLPFLIVEVTGRDALRRARGDISVHARVLTPLGTDAVYAYCLDRGPHQLQARAFAPLDGCIEDPATGSATAAAIALRALCDRQADGTTQWVVEQGVDLGRPSLILGVVVKEGGTVRQVRIAGHAVTVMQGSLIAGYE
jgi:trans-2,3-dihydro-3-hydroxyanthranilate isomerase